MLAGDWHGDLEWAVNMVAITKASGVNFLFHVGDFGIWRGARAEKYLEVLEQACATGDVMIFVTPGNHEDWPRIDAMEIGEGGLQWVSEHIALIPRGHRWEMNGRTFVSLGGAPSIDFPTRTAQVDWFPTEMIPLEVAEAVAEAGHADVMLTHDSPTQTSQPVKNIIYDKDAGRFWTREGLKYAREGRKILDIAVKGVQPGILFHGHFHAGGIGIVPDNRVVVSLDQQRTKKNMVFLDLDSMAFDFVDPWEFWGKRALVPVKVVG